MQTWNLGGTPNLKENVVGSKPFDFLLLNLQYEYSLSNYVACLQVAFEYESRLCLDAKMSLTLNKPNIESFLFKTLHSLQKWAETHQRWKVLYSILPTHGQKSSRVELKENSSVLQPGNTSFSFWRPLIKFPSLVDKDKDDLRSKYVILKNLQVHKFKSYRKTHKRGCRSFWKSRRRILYSSCPE